MSEGFMSHKMREGEVTGALGTVSKTLDQVCLAPGDLTGLPPFYQAVLKRLEYFVTTVSVVHSDARADGSKGANIIACKYPCMPLVGRPAYRLAASLCGG